MSEFIDFNTLISEQYRDARMQIAGKSEINKSIFVYLQYINIYKT